MHATLCDYLADLTQNAIESGAAWITVKLVEDDEKVTVTITDDGKGIDAATTARIWDPFYSEAGKHDHRRVGLGLPLLNQLVDATGGHIRLDTSPGCGTTVHFSLPADHPDIPPTGCLPATLMGLMSHEGGYDLSWHHARGDNSYTVTRSELREALGDLNSAASLTLMRDYLQSQEDDLKQQI